MHKTDQAMSGRRIVPMLLLIGLFAHAPIVAAEFPSGPIKYVVPAPPAGLLDIMARQVANSIGDSMGQPIIVENKPGGATMIGAAYVAKAPPDGQTWLASTISFASNATLRQLTFDMRKDLIPVVKLASTPMGIVVPANSPYRTIQELVSASRSGKSLNYGTSGAGTPAHLGTVMFEAAAGIKGNHIPYKGGAPLLNDLIGGQLDYTLVALSEARGFISSGRARLLAVASAQRLLNYPDVPTIMESGYPRVLMEGWTGIMVPGGTPPQIVDKIAETVLAAAAKPEFVKRAEDIGYVMTPLGPKDAARQFNEDIRRLRTLIETHGITAGQ